MDYYDRFLVGAPLVFLLVTSLLGAVGVDATSTMLAAFLIESGLVWHALFVRPPVPE